MTVESVTEGDASEAKSVFKTLCQCPEVGEMLLALHQATGITIYLIPVGYFAPYDWFKTREQPFCAAMRRHELGLRAYSRMYITLLDRVKRVGIPQRMKCFAQMIHLAVPVTVGGEHVATLLAGQILFHKPRKANFAKVRKYLVQLGLSRELSRLEKLWMIVTAIPPERFEGCADLITAFARMIGNSASRWGLAVQEGEPRYVKQAKEFIIDHIDRHISLQEIAARVHLSPKHFSRMFKKTTGITLTEHIWLARIEKAKLLLRNPKMSVKEVAFACGFRSRSHFNHVFHGLIGSSPTNYRADIRQSKVDKEHINHLAL